jgi:hypothetical protein
MKYYTLALSTIIPALSCAMEQEIEIRNRNLDTPEKPQITIINKLPKDAGFSTRIDISDTTKISNKNNYKPDDSTETIWANKGIRFSPNLNKNENLEHNRLGMNDAGNAALVALYIHGIQNSLIHLVVGEGSRIKFGNTVTITTKSYRPDEIFIKAEFPDQKRRWESPFNYHTSGYGNSFFINKNSETQKAELIGHLTSDILKDVNRPVYKPEEYYTDFPYITALIEEHNK